jgi:hypothetical protein
VNTFNAPTQLDALTAAPVIRFGRDRLAVARLLAARGPIPGADATSVLGWSADRWWAVVGVSAGLFDFTGKGWVLTTAGRALTAAVGPSA